MPPNYVHKIVHISTLLYQSLSIISASGRKNIKDENSKGFLTPNTFAVYSVESYTGCPIESGTADFQ